MHSKIIKKLLNKKITVATAESCSGGLLSYNFIKHRDTSKIFKFGIICYSNESKIKQLNIKINSINKYGAVSPTISKQMTNNLSKISKCDLNISTTGIAGPTGNTKNKPIGLVYVGIKYKNKLYVHKKKFNGNRIQIQEKTVSFIFGKLKKLI